MGGSGGIDGPSESRSRRPAVAGSFYPAEPDALAAEVERCLAAAVPPAHPAGPPPVALIVPHAGLAYSGSVAAAGWRAIAEPGPARAAGRGARAGAGGSGRGAHDGPPTILLAGTNHSARFDGIAVWDGGPWEMPFGAVEVDAPWSEALLALGAPFVAAPSAHAREHSLEVQLPLVARLLPGARIAPFLVSTGDPVGAIAAGARLGRAIAERRDALGPVVVVASSDLAHYPDEPLAREIDEHVLEPIIAVDPEELRRRELAVRAAELPGVACGLCGLDPVLLVLAAARALGVRRGSLLDHRTSADAGGDPRRVVGYASVAFAA